MLKAIGKLNAKLSRLAKSYSENSSGLAAVEFGLIAPILLIMLIGIFEISQGLSVSRKVTSAGSTIGDLTSQALEMSDEDIEDTFGSAMAIMFPNSAGPLKMRLTSVEIDPVGDATVAWSDSSNWSSLPEGAPVTLPGGMNVPNTSVIMSEIEYDYTSLFGEFLPGTTTFNDRFFFIPRRTVAVQRE